MNDYRDRVECYAGWLLAASLLIGLSAGGRCLGGSPAAAPSTAAKTFDAVAQDIEKSVTRLGYPKSTADDLVQLVRGWDLETWKQKLAQARSTPGPRNTAEIARVEEEATKAIYVKIGEAVNYCGDERYANLSAVARDRKAQCLGYSQVFYVLGSSVGLSVSVTDVLELAAGPLPAGEAHVACIVSRPDSTCIVVDLAQRFASQPFVFRDEYGAAGNYWELKRKDNPLGIHRRIQVCNESGIVACIHYSVGYAYAKAGQSVRAISCFTKAIELNPKYAEAFYNRGNRYGELKQLALAIADYDAAIELDPKFAWAFNNRGNACLGLRQHAQAISDYNRAIELDSKNAEAFYNRGVAYGRMEQPARAISDYNRAIELDPKLAAAYAGRGIDYAVQGKKDEARADLKKALELKPSLREWIRKLSDQFQLGL